MSRLSDLLNPAPSPQSTPRPVDVHAEAAHGRNPSITSPLEALAIAATTQSASDTYLAQAPSGSLPSISHSHPAPLYPPAKQDSVHNAPILSSGSVKTELHTPHELKTMSASADPQGDAKSADAQETSQTLPPPASDSTHGAEVQPEQSHKPSIPNILTEVKKEPETNPPTPTLAVQSPTVLPTTEGKKRPAPKASKKGTASVIKKPAPKKRKVEAGSKDGTPMSQRSGTPNSSRASKTPAPKSRKRNSATPAQSSPPRSVEGDEEADDDDGELFCICRRPDNHKWMIGCDGGCDDWFHGKCVNMREEDAELIDKYICPNCTDKGIGVTTWKPMCRLEGCREPARVAPPNPSKYCCDEHGEEFMRQKIFGKGNATATAAKKRKAAGKAEPSYGGVDGASETGNNQAHLRGGHLQPGELQSLASSTKDVGGFRKLGESVLAADKINENISNGDPIKTEESNEHLCTPEERSRLEEIKTRQIQLNHKLDALQDKEKLLSMVKSRAAQTLTELNKELSKKPTEGKKKETLKDICGFDSRLSWSDVEFDEWRQSSVGIQTLQSNQLGPPISHKDKADADGDTSMGDRESDEADEIGKGVCQKKRCERHKAWHKLHQQEIASERGECNQHLRRLDHESKGINERAMLKRLESEADAQAGTEAKQVQEEQQMQDVPDVQQAQE